MFSATVASATYRRRHEPTGNDYTECKKPGADTVFRNMRALPTQQSTSAHATSCRASLGCTSQRTL